MTALRGRLRRKRLVKRYCRRYRARYCQAGVQRRGRATSIIGLAGLLFGACLLALPVASDLLADRQQRGTITSVQSTYEPSSNPKIRAAIAQAKRYNAALAGKKVTGRVLPYEKQLEFRNNSSNAWIEIPSIGVNLAIYKGATERTLAAGVGHLPGTSLPVGGTPSNCVLTAHSGMPNARMFDDIRNLRKGDRMVVHTLGYSFAYEVEESEVVLPDQTEHLQIYRRDRDMLTLVTCTPYGVNDHRLLVHCRRVPYDPNTATQQPAATPTSFGRLVPLLIAAAAIVAVVVIRAVRTRKRRRNPMTGTYHHRNGSRRQRVSTTSPIVRVAERAQSIYANSDDAEEGSRQVRSYLKSTARSSFRRQLLLSVRRDLIRLIKLGAVLAALLLIWGIMTLASSCSQAWADEQTATAAIAPATAAESDTQALPIHDSDSCSGLKDVGDVWFAWPSRKCTQWSLTGTETAYQSNSTKWRSPDEKIREWKMGKATVTGDLAITEAIEATHKTTGSAEFKANWGITVNRKLTFNQVNNIDGAVVITWKDIARDPYGAYYDMSMTVDNIKVRPHTQSTQERTYANGVVVLNSTDYGCNANAAFCGEKMISLVGAKWKKHQQSSHVSVSMDIEVSILKDDGSPVTKDPGKDVVAAFRDLDSQVLEENDPSGPWSESVTLRSGFAGTEVHAGKPMQKELGGQETTVRLLQDGARYYGAQSINGSNLNATDDEEDAVGFAVRAYANGYRYTWTGDHCGTKLFDRAGGEKPSPQSIELAMGKTLDGSPATEPGRFAFTATATHTGNGTTIAATAENDETGTVTFRFDALHAGTYEVAVKETSTGTYSVPCGKASITVESDGDGGIRTAGTSWEGDDTYRNYTYPQVVIPVEKQLSVPEGRRAPDVSGAFTFKLEPVNTAATGSSERAEPTAVTNPDPAGGSAAFGAITFKKPGTYTYRVSEEGTVRHVTNDPRAEGETVSVKVELAGDRLAVTKVHAANEANRIEGGVRFTNTYVPPDATDFAIPVTKRLTNDTPWDAPDIAGKFTFTLSAVDGAPLPEAGAETAVNPDADGGTAHFGTITYEDEGTYRYRITEHGQVDGVANDGAGEDGREVTVTVVDGDDGKLHASSDAETAAVFTNACTDRPVQAAIPATKRLACGPGAQEPDITGAFRFELQGEEGAPLPSDGTEAVNPDADGGTVRFGQISFERPGTYRYTVTESGQVDGVVNDPAAEQGKAVTVEVGRDRRVTVRDADGARLGDEGVVFTNSVPAPAQFALPVTKTLAGTSAQNPAPDITGAFTFTLAAVDGAPLPGSGTTMVANPASDGGTAYFDPITFDRTGTYRYRVTEEGSVARMENDDCAQAGRLVTIEVTRDAAANKLDARVASVDDAEQTAEGGAENTGAADAEADGEVDAETADSIGGSAALVFTNTLEPLPAQLQIPVNKVLAIGGDGTPPDITGAFRFTLEALDGAPLPDGGARTVTNPDRDGGTARYERITYAEPGTYRYRITETGAVADVTNDPEPERTVQVKVTRDAAANTLAATVEQVEGGSESEGTAAVREVTFTNTYHATAAMPLTGGTGLPWQAAAACLAAMAAGAVLFAKRKSLVRRWVQRR